MNTLSTHDTKRSDDVRARLAVLTRLPRYASSAAPMVTQEPIERWARSPIATQNIFSTKRSSAHGRLSRPDEGVHGEGRARGKAADDLDPTEQRVRAALKTFIERIHDFAGVYGRPGDLRCAILLPGRINSLTQTLIKCIAPGVPDNYQGGENRDLHLVDPDNRGEVDYDVRRAMLSELENGMPV